MGVRLLKFYERAKDSTPDTPENIRLFEQAFKELGLSTAGAAGASAGAGELGTAPAVIGNLGLGGSRLSSDPRAYRSRP